MTRIEEIKHKAGSISDGMIAHNVPLSRCKGYYEGYIDGAKYADSTMIQKACRWILHNMHKYVKWHPTESLTVCVNNEDMADSFREAMEE